MAWPANGVLGPEQAGEPEPVGRTFGPNPSPDGGGGGSPPPTEGQLWPRGNAS